MNILNRELDSVCEKIEQRLLSFYEERKSPAEIGDKAVLYSLMSGGKRIRPFLVMEICKSLSGDYERALSSACALEMIHTCSLIHDDLPAMDNDSMRRGKPSCHIAFGEANAILAGDALMTDAFEMIARSCLSDCEKAASVLSLSVHSGRRGMMAGQVVDLDPSKENSSDVLDMLTELKTAELIRCAGELGAIAAGKGDDPSLMQTVDDYCFHLGMTFQITDDILDHEEKPDTFDYVSLYGKEEAMRMAVSHSEISADAVSAIDRFGILTAFVRMLPDRTK